MAKKQIIACLVSMAAAFQVLSCSKDTIPEPPQKMAINNYVSFYDRSGKHKSTRIAMHWHDFEKSEYERMVKYVGRVDTFCITATEVTLLTYEALPDTCVNNSIKY